MMPLIRKELKENAKWIPVGLIIMLVLAWAATPASLASYMRGSRTHHELIAYFGYASPVFAVFLGVMQTVWDFSDRNRGYLLHRAVSLNEVLLSKVVSGAIVYFTVTLIPLILVAVFFAAKGIEQLPFRPLQVIAPLSMVCLFYFFHPAAMWMMIRPGKWYGTKLLPISVPVVVCLLYSQAADNSWVSWVAFASCLLVLTAFGSAIFVKALQPSMLITSACIVVAGAIIIFIVLLESINQARSNPYEQVANQIGSDKDANLWLYKYRSGFDEKVGRYQVNYVSGSRLEPGSVATTQGKLPDGFEGNWVSKQVEMADSPQRFGSISTLYSTGRQFYAWDERGYILVYQLSSPSGLIGVISRDGFTKGSVPVGRRFAGKPHQLGFNLGVEHALKNPMDQIFIKSHLVWCDCEGVYLLDATSNKLEIVVDKSILTFTPLYKEQNLLGDFLFETSTELLRYRGNIGDGVSEKPLGLKLIASYPKLPGSDMNAWWVAAGTNGQLVAIDSTLSGNATVARIASTEQSAWDVSNVMIKRDNERNRLQEVGFGFVPPAVGIAFIGLLLAIQIFYNETLPDMGQIYPSLSNFLAAMAFSIVVAMVLAVWLSRRRGLSKGLLISWVVGCIPLGLAAPLALAAIYSKLAYERCSGCERPRRVDRLKCEHCGADWDAAALQGIEIYEENANKNLAYTS